MGTATPIRLTKPRLSALILEATAMAVSVVLVLWLLLWFVHRTVDKAGVEAYFVRVEGVPAEDAPLRAADVRRFQGPQGSGEIQETRPGDLVDEIKKKVGSGAGTLVIYVSAPVVDQATGTDATGAAIRDLIGIVAGEARRDVVLALDLAQIDTDRNLGVFGNSPYSLVQETIETLKKPDKRVFVMTSAAPGQKSWSADGLGQSIFAYYLRQGLEEEARGWDEKRRDSITVRGLHRYVQSHVRDWVWKNRHESVQTPMLLPVQADPEDSSTPVLQAIAVGASPSRPPSEPAPAASPTSVAESPAKAEAPIKPDPVAKTDSQEDLQILMKTRFAALIAEWKQHDELKDKEKPYRFFPGAWRTYEASLLRAERRLRAAWLDRQEPGALARVSQGLDKVESERKALADKLGDREKSEAGFPFRSVLGESDGRGRRELERALTAVTGGGPIRLELLPPRQNVPGPIADPGKGAGQPQPAQGADKGVPAPGSTEITPGPYLELQLLAWAREFEKQFNREHYFRGSESRKEVLRDLVEARADAERALDMNRSGLGWIERVVQNGDEDRHMIQDEILSGTKEDGPRNRWKEPVEKVASLYRQARQRSADIEMARATWEEAAADLPLLVEWAVRRDSYGSNPSQPPSDAIAELPERALDGLNRLSRLLGTEPDESRSTAWFRDLAKATEDTRKSLDSLHGDFRKALEQLELENRDWTALDAALRTPFIPSRTRERLLSKLLELDERAVRVRPPSAKESGGNTDQPADPGFLIRAAGLARLDLMLGRIARDPGLSDEEAPGLKQLKSAWSKAKAYSEEVANASDDRSAFPNFTEVVRKEKVEPKDLDSPAQTGLRRSRNHPEPILFPQDRRARLLDAWRLERVGAGKLDEAAKRYEQFFRYAALDFHLRRLREDYADADTLGELARQVQAAAYSVPIQTEELPDTHSPSLKVQVKGKDSLQLVNWSGDLEVQLLPPKDVEGSIPSGQAFVGVAEVTPKGLEVDQVSSGMVIPGRLVNVGTPQFSEPADAGKYQLVQWNYAAKDFFRVKAIAFYRGRVDKGSVDTANVSPTRLSDLVTITIGQDKKLWQQKYAGVNPDDIVDQFISHPHEGYMHLGKSLDYVLTFENQVPEEMEMTCQIIELTDPANPQADKGTIKHTEATWRLGRKGSPEATRTFAGKVSLSKERPDDTHVLKVTLTDVKPKRQRSDLDFKPWSKSFEVTFYQKTVESYMDIKGDIRRDCAKDHPFCPRCYVVIYRRRDDDRYTEPIRADEWSCTILEKPGTLRARDWIKPGDGWEFHYYNDPGRTTFPWSGRIENESLEGEGLKDWKRPEKKP